MRLKFSGWVHVHQIQISRAKEMAIFDEQLQGG